MAARTITLDDEAYEILNQRKRPGQSYSQVIKESLAPPRRHTAADLLKTLETLQVSEDTLDRIEEVIQARR